MSSNDTSTQLCFKVKQELALYCPLHAEWCYWILADGYMVTNVTKSYTVRSLDTLHRFYGYVCIVLYFIVVTKYFQGLGALQDAWRGHPCHVSLPDVKLRDRRGQNRKFWASQCRNFWLWQERLSREPLWQSWNKLLGPFWHCPLASNTTRH